MNKKLLIDKKCDDMRMIYWMIVIVGIMILTYYDINIDIELLLISYYLFLDNNHFKNK